LNLRHQNLCTSFYAALGKINLLLAPAADMFPVKLIGKNFNHLSTVRAFAGKGFKMFKLFKTGAMSWDHDKISFHFLND
jgi:hypothetical protein